LWGRAALGPGRTPFGPTTRGHHLTAATHAWAASLRRTRHIGDFRAWKDHDQYQKSFERLSCDLKA
jgi:hypothetical protein